MTNAINNLPPEMQERLAQILANNQPQPESPHQAAIATTPTGQQIQTQQQLPQQQAPAKPPSLLQHVVALRQENAEMRQQLAAIGQVLEAVGNAVGQIYGALYTPEGGQEGADF